MLALDRTTLNSEHLTIIIIFMRFKQYFTGTQAKLPKP